MYKMQLNKFPLFYHFKFNLINFNMFLFIIMIIIAIMSTYLII